MAWQKGGIGAAAAAIYIRDKIEILSARHLISARM